MLWTSKNSGTLHMQVIVGLLLVTSLISQVNAEVTSCYSCEMHGSEGVSCENPLKQQCPPQARASCLKAKAEQKDPTGKGIPVQLKSCESSKGPTDPANPPEVCEDYGSGETKGRRCFCFTDNCNDGSFPELRQQQVSNKTDSLSAGAPHFTGSPQTISSHVTFSLGGSLLLYLLASII